MRKGILFLLLLTCFQYGSAFAVPATPTGYVNDYAGIIDESTRLNLEEELRLFTASTTNEIAVVTIKSLEGDTIERYATNFFDRWKIGSAKNDNGVLLLISVDDRQVRIEVGYGLEGALPDILAKDIINNQISPSFKQGDYSKGIVDGVHSIQEATRGEYQGSGAQKNNSIELNGSTFELILFGVLFISQILASLFARSKSWWAGGIVGGGIGGLITYFQFFGISFVGGLFITAGLSVIGFLLDYLVSNNYAQSVRKGVTPSWWSGGRGFGGGSSFGGFSGGGTGGGGATGRW